MYSSTIVRRISLGIAAFCVLTSPASAFEGRADSEKTLLLVPAHSAKKYSKQEPIEVGIVLTPDAVQRAFNGAGELSCSASTVLGSDGVKMKSKLVRSVTFIDQDGNETTVKLGSKNRKGSFVSFEYALPEVDLAAIGPDLRALVSAELKLLKKKKITRVRLLCAVEYS